jgi:hypothetical protein
MGRYRLNLNRLEVKNAVLNATIENQTQKRLTAITLNCSAAQAPRAGIWAGYLGIARNLIYNWASQLEVKEGNAQVASVLTLRSRQMLFNL